MFTKQNFREVTPEYAKQLISYLPKRPDYRTWIYTISAIGNTFPESTAIEILLSHFQDERTNETVYKVNNRLKDVTFGTLVYLAKENGYRPEKKPINNLYEVFINKGIEKYALENKTIVGLDSYSDKEFIKSDGFRELVKEILEIYRKEELIELRAKGKRFGDAYE